MLVTCPDVTVMWLLGHFTHIAWYRVSTECVCAWTSALWLSHTQCVRLHVIITEHTDTGINILTACFMVQVVSWQTIIVETQLQSQACTLGFVVEKVAMRQVLYTSTSVSLSVSFHLCSVHLFIFGIGSIINWHTYKTFKYYYFRRHSISKTLYQGHIKTYQPVNVIYQQLLL